MGSNVTLMNLSEKRMEWVVKCICNRYGVFLKCHNFRQQIQNRLFSRKVEIESLEKDINLGEFRKITRSPQISDILNDYICYILTISITGIVPKEKILEDEVINYVISVLEENFPKLSEDSTIYSIKKYFGLIFGIYKAPFDNSVYSDLVERKNGRIFEGVLIDSVEDKEWTKKYSVHLERVLEQEFIPRNTKFDSIRNEYAKALKNYYQYGFIYLLGEYKFSEFYIPPILVNGLTARHMYWRQLQRIDRRRLDRSREIWKHIFDDRDIVYVVGGAGYGKSLFLKNIINDYTKLNIENSQDYLLIYCDLKSYYASGDSNGKTMVDFFKDSMISTTGKEGISKEFIQYFLDIGRCIVLLDALDEVPRDKRSELHKKITTFFATCNPNNKVCITSRDRGFIPQKDIEVLEILPLNEKDIEDYIDKMIALKKFKREDKETFMRQAQVLIDKEFLNNFLVLSLLVNIYKAEKELPENKIDLYKKCFEYIAKKREEEKSKTGYDWKSIYPLMKDSTFISLSRLAAPNNKDISRDKIEELLLKQYRTKYIDEAAAECAIKEFLEFCSNRTELFVPSSVDDKFKFFHRSFFEYFYSRYIHQQPQVSTMYELMEKFDIDSEVFELTVALVKEDNEEKYQELIELILSKVQEELGKTEQSCTAFGILTLAMQVIDDAYYIQKYYEIIIQYHELMSTKQMYSMNQKLISMWVEKVICEDEDKKQEFLETYGDQCICYMLLLTERIRINKKQQMQIVVENGIIENDIAIDYELPFAIGRFPFYISLYNKYGDLYALMEKCVQRGLASVNIGNMKKSKMKKGLYNYKKISHEEKEKFFKVLLRAGI